MYFSSPLTALAAALTLATQGSAFVMDIYDSDNCSGPARSVNVWDNTCATWMGGFRSYAPRVYGGAHQKSYFFIPGNCGDLTSSLNSRWVDGGDGWFQTDHCYNFGNGRVVNAVASYSG
ncbi:hypothetical protein BCR34DRAFT_667357 [Clohesyomyces aquaticus]|uniref:Uncharacterized protein n=1 Tax=Clohesyomyces aquaticus TaxID=1231657 RepID=A0A1Y1Z045_9PLEO|nr:hypothetical protein BCR34DRAFT_667357 [Clohesyomyces aquaticus]